MALRAVLPRDRTAFCRDIATPAARIRYEELQVVARRQGSDRASPLVASDHCGAKKNRYSRVSDAVRVL